MVTPTPFPVTQILALHKSLTQATDKGKALEALCVQFFSAIAGLKVDGQRVLDDAKSQEVDVTLWNFQHADGLPMLDEIIFVEAKNWSSPVGSAEVAWFDWKVRLSSYHHGFLIATNGITGRKDDLSSAWSIVYEASKEKRKLLILTPDEMIQCQSSVDFQELVRAKLMRIATRKAQI